MTFHHESLRYLLWTEEIFEENNLNFCDHDLQLFLKGCLAYDCEERPKAEELLSLTFLQIAA